MSQDIDEDFCPGLKGKYMASTLERACLCCPFQIGMLYDCNKDKLLPGKPLWDIDPNSDGHSCRSQVINDPKFSVSIDDNFEWKCDQLGVVDSCTKLSFLSGWVDYQGAAKVLRDNKVSKTQARVILASKSMMKMEEFVPDQTKLDLSDTLLKGATHVVVGVLYGINMFFVFDQKVCEGEDYNAVQSSLEEKVRALTKPQQSGEFTTGTKLVSIKYYGDLKLDEHPTTFEQVARLCHNTPKKLNVPMKVWLHPLGQLEDRAQQNFVLKISEAITDSLQQLVRSLREFEVRSHDLSIRTTCSYFIEMRETFGHMERLVKTHRDELQKILFDSLSRVRNGKADETELCSIVGKNKDSPFNCQYLASWFDNKDKEVKTLDGYLKQLQQLECIQFAFTDFDEYMTDTEVEHILCFDFNIVQQDNNILQKMEDYNNGRKVNQEIANLRPSHKDHRMREQIRRFKVFVKSNLRKDDLKFVVTNGESENISKTGVILLFVEGSPTEFEPPDKPGKPVLSGWSGNCLCLSWEAPKNGVECIESYTVSYRSDPADEWCNKKASKLSIVLPGLLPDTVYYVKIKAVTSAGSSPERISDIRTPPEEPGKPHASCVTHNSFILKWDKSQQSLSYIILYRSSNDPADKWWSHSVSPSAESSALLSNLSPMTTYYCKVTAEISDGLTLESDISEPIKTMLPVSQPGKPHASDVTHNSLRLSWSKATAADGNSILHYSIAYKSVDKSVEEWHTKETTSAQEHALVEHLDCKKSYFFKVHAVTAMGSGPESDQSDLINMKLPISRPGKPCASKITHNSVELTWDIPDIEGAANVQSYTIFYQSDNLSTEWHTQQTPACQQKKLVTNLKSKTVYHFKVRAETAAGLGPESDLSDSIETLLSPPDKLQVLSVSHNSINLNWQKPARGSDCIQSYTVSFRPKDDASGKWCSRNTNSTEESFILDNITSNMSYYLKVRAETATGPGAECKLGDPILTILPPPERLKFIELTCHSVCLSWQKPECDEYVTYVVFYHSDGNDKWSSQTTDKGIPSLNVIDLLPGRFYHFKVIAKTADGTISSESSTIKVFLPPDQPSKPWATNVSSSSIELTWDKPKHGFDSVENYTVFYRSEKSDTWEKNSTADGRESIILTKLIPKTVYLFKIQAMTSMKPSPESQISDPIETLLSSPSKPLATNITHNSLQINWKKPKCGAETVTSYTISCCKLPGQWQIAHTTQEYFVCSNLVPKTEYRFKVRAETATGSSLESELSDIFETLLPSPGKPYASKKTHNSIKLCWEKPERGSESVVAYTVFSRLGNDPHSEWIPQTSNSTIHSLDFYNLIPGSLFVFKVRAETATDSSPESDTAIVTLPPGQPSTPQISSYSRDSVHISWTMPAEHGATSVQRYTVLYCSIADSAEKLHSCSTHGTEGFIQISNLLPGTVYSFKVRAEGAGGSSPESESVEVTLPPDQPGKPEAYAVFHDNIKLKWSPPTHGAQIVRNYLIYYRLQSSKSKNWQLYASENANVCISGLNHTATYVFKVKAETEEVGSSPDSELSDPIVTLLPPPGKPRADPKNISYEKFVVKWQKPKISANIKHYSLFYRSVDDEPIDKWCILRMFDNKTNFTFNATPGKVYVFKVSAVTTDGAHTAESELSDPIQTKIKPWGAQLIGKCKKITATKPDECPTYQLPLSTTMKKKDIEKMVVGGLPSRRLSTGIPHKVLMVVGATGAGKSTLINGMANYIMGVDWEDEYRFKLISEETAHDQTKSQTRCITAYTFYKEDCKGSSLSFTLTVIDTPGFGDTGGLERDKEIVKQVKELFSIPGKDGIDQLHGIGFVTQAPQARLTPTQRYVFDSILSVFGKDVADNIFLMVTFADGKQPPVIDAARAAGVPFMNYFKFNNSALFASNQASDNEFDKIFWRMGKNSFEDFFSHFLKAETQSLQQSREVLQKREQLEVTIQGLQPQIRAGLAKIDELRQERQLLKDHEADIITHRDFTYQVQITKQRMIELPTGRFTTNCLKCNFTCHDNCKYANDGDKFKCSAMSKQGEKNATCKVCPKKCSWKEHVNNPYRFEIYQEMETRTSDELKAKYDSAMSDKDQVETVMKKMMTELEDMDCAVLMKIEQARETLQRLEEIALRPSHLTEVDYIDILIESEQQEARPGWSQRVKALREVREQAKILAQIQSNPIQSPKTNPDEQQKLWEKMWDGFKSLVKL